MKWKECKKIKNTAARALAVDDGESVPDSAAVAIKL